MADDAVPAPARPTNAHESVPDAETAIQLSPARFAELGTTHPDTVIWAFRCAQVALQNYRNQRNEARAARDTLQQQLDAQAEESRTRVRALET